MACTQNNTMSNIKHSNRGGGATDDASVAKHAQNETHHVHFSPRPKIRRFPSQTKAWTDQSAPEPFSTPKSRQRKLGYGDFLKNKAGENGEHSSKISYPNSYHGGRPSSSTVFRRSCSHGTGRKGNDTIQRGASFNQHDFPCLSPAKQQPKPVRMASWSSVAGNNSLNVKENDVQKTELNALDMIPPPPLMKDPPTLLNKQQVSFKDEHIDIEALQEDELLSQSSALFCEETPVDSFQRQHSRSASFSSHTHEYSPFDTFTTMSRSCLQNDIGTLLARYNRVDEAIERYKHSIEVATVDRDGLKVALEHLSLSADKETESTMPQSSPKLKCPKVTEAEGLAWYHQKLLKGDMAAAPPSTNSSDHGLNGEIYHSPKQTISPPFQPAGFGGLAPPMSPVRRLRSASFGVDAMTSFAKESFEQTPIRKTMTTSLPCPVTAPYPVKQHAVMHELRRCNSHSTRIQQQSTVESSVDKRLPKSVVLVDDIEIYSCNGLTPLGLEYICDPLPVLGTALRKLVGECISDDELSDFGIIDNICEASATKRRKRMIAALLMDSAALIASKINLASLIYKRALDLEEVLGFLRQAMEDFDSVQQIIQNDPLNQVCHKNFMDVFGLLEIVGHLNLGTALYRANKVRDAMSSFECSKSKLDKKRTIDDEVTRYSFEVDSTNSYDQHPHDDNRLPSNDYLLLAARSGISRVYLRLSDHENAKKICELVAEDNKPHRRNSSRIIYKNTSRNYSAAGYGRSDSFSVTTSAVNTAAAAYQHNLDRRYKWLSLVVEQYINGLIHELRGDTDDYKYAVNYYNRLLSETRKKYDHRHPFVCSLLERRGAVLFEQRKLQCSMLSYLACLKILEHQQVTQNNIFQEADMARILYAVARVLHDKEDYHDALHMYQRALVSQRSSAGDKPSLNVITTLCNISRVHHLCGEIDEALTTNKEVFKIATKLVGGKMDHPFLIHRLKVEGNILIEAGRLEDAMSTFIDAARRCCEDGRNRMITTLMGGSSTSGSAQEDADAGDSSVLSMRSAAALAHIAFLHPAAPAG